MGAWGSGLLENDDALDALAELMEAVPWGDGAERAAVRLAVLAEVDPSGLEMLDDAGDLRVDGLPPAAAALVRRIAVDPEAVTEESGPHDADLVAAVGEGAVGPQLEPLYALPAAPAVLGDVAETCAQRLDRAPDDPAGALAALAVLAVLADRVEVAAERVSGWRTALDGVVPADADVGPHVRLALSRLAR